MTDSAANNPNPVLTFEGKRYDLNTLPDELKELVPVSYTHLTLPTKG